MADCWGYLPPDRCKIQENDRDQQVLPVVKLQVERPSKVLGTFEKTFIQPWN